MRALKSKTSVAAVAPEPGDPSAEADVAAGPSDFSTDNPPDMTGSNMTGSNMTGSNGAGTNGMAEAAATSGGPDRAAEHPAGRSGSTGSLRRLYTVPERMTHDERDRQAQEEFTRAVSPATDLLRQAVPGAGSPEEAAKFLAESQGEYIADPDGGASIPGDSFSQDRRVYYRLLHRDYHPDPRPRRRLKSHRLADRPGLLPGTRGW